MLGLVMYCCPWLTTFNVEVQPRHIKYKHKQFQKFGSEEDNCYISFLKFVTQDQNTQQIKEPREAEKKRKYIQITLSPELIFPTMNKEEMKLILTGN